MLGFASLAAEFASNIRAVLGSSLPKFKNCTQPMLKNLAVAEGIAKAYPLKRLGEGKDSASLLKILINKESSYFMDYRPFVIVSKQPTIKVSNLCYVIFNISTNCYFDYSSGSINLNTFCTFLNYKEYLQILKITMN